MQDFRKLRAWQAAHRAAVAVYGLTRHFPKSETFGITAQLRRATASIGANIAESCGRATDADRRRCLQIALGSACEALNHALLARDLSLLSEEALAEIETSLQPARQMLIRLIERIEADQRRDGSRRRAR